MGRRFIKELYMADNKLSVAFIGTGIMGAPIARHILEAGYPVTVYNRTRDKASALLEAGAAWADTAVEAVKGADVVFTMVGYPSDVEELYLAGEGLLTYAKDGAYLIDLTTSAPELARDIAEAAEVSGKHAFDMPVTGGEQGAINGTLTGIIGATERDVAPVRAIIETFTDKLFFFNGPGRGQAAKLCNQIALAGCMVGMADALSLAQQSDLDLDKVRQMICAGTGASGAMEVLAPKSIVGDYKPGFQVVHMLKDLGLALQSAEDKELALPGTDTAFTLFDMLEAIGGGKLGTQAITLLYQEEAEAVAAGLDWSLYNAEHEHEDGDGCDCGCGHDHEDEGHDCDCGHEHGEGHVCTCGHEHGHERGDHECCCGGHHEE